MKQDPSCLYTTGNIKEKILVFLLKSVCVYVYICMNMCVYVLLPSNGQNLNGSASHAYMGFPQQNIIFSV